MTIKTFIYEHSTGEARVEELSGAALNEFLASQAEAVARKEAEQQAAAAAAAKRQVLLDKLGITEDEAKLLLGGN